MQVDIKKPLKKYLPHLLQARTDNLNEADTLQRLVRVFEEVFGYDPMTDISGEARLKGKYVDLVLKIDGVIRMLVEVKAANEILRDRHIEQAQGYASRNNYRWVLLTNGVVWNLYHLTFEQGIEYDLAFSVDLSLPNKLDENIESLSVLHKATIKKGGLESFWERSTALSPASIGRALCREDVLMVLRKQLRKDQGMLMDPEDLLGAVHAMLSADAREAIGPMKILRNRQRKPVTKDAVAMTGQVAAVEDVPATNNIAPEVAASDEESSPSEGEENRD